MAAHGPRSIGRRAGPMLPAPMADLPPFADFPPQTEAEWRTRAEADLKGRPLDSLDRDVEGLTVHPLYTQAPGSSELAPGQFPFRRGARALGGWTTCGLVDLPDPYRASAAARRAVSLGARSVRFSLDADVRRGAPWQRLGSGVVVRDNADLRVMVDGLVPGEAMLWFDAGVSAATIARGLDQVLGDDAADAHCAVLADPLAVLAEHGSLEADAAQALADAASLACARADSGATVWLGVSTEPYQAAGATAADQLGVALASSVELLRHAETAGLDLELVASRLVWRFAVGRDLFLEVAKLRAARLLWARVATACGLSPQRAALPIHAAGAWRERTRRDPWVNLLRGTVESFAAVVGGADEVATLPLDAALDGRGPLGRRLAVNTQVLLREESHLDRVADPAGGSYYLESLTDELAAAGWAAFQTIEREGGLLGSLQAGAIQARCAAGAERERRALAVGKRPVVGVSEFALLDEKPVPAEAKDTAMPADRPALDEPESSNGAPTATRVSPLVRARLAEPFEQLRDRSEAFREREGCRPPVFLANLGPLRVHKARADFATNLLHAGGFEVLSPDGFDDAPAVAEAFAASGARVAVICSSDDVYAERAAATATALRDAGAGAIVLAGRPRDADFEAALRTAGVDHFMFLRGDALALLEALLDVAAAANQLDVAAAANQEDPS